MSSALHEQPYLESWRWMSRQIRCGMDPDEPRLIEHYLAEGRYLACCTATSPWTIAETSFRLLLDTAADVALPWHWRTYGLDSFKEAFTKAALTRFGSGWAWVERDPAEDAGGGKQR